MNVRFLPVEISRRSTEQNGGHKSRCTVAPYRPYQPLKGVLYAIRSCRNMAHFRGIKWHDSHQPTTDVAWHVLVCAWADYGAGGTTLTNVRMGLAAHLEGVMNGTFLIALGAIWNEVRLPRPGKLTAYWTALYGTYANWLTTTFAAIFGTAAWSPITSAGHSGQPWQEALVSAGFLSVSISIVVSGVLLVWGLRASASMSQERRCCEPVQPIISVSEINDNERTQ
jgi:(hydroxyamino)benzene mutase